MRLKFGFIPFPLAIVDDGIDLSLVEYRLLGYLLRHRFRVKSEAMRLTQDELLRGAFGPSGERRDRGCGITSPRDLKLARERLKDRKWLTVQDTPSGMVYELCLDDDESDASDAPSASSPAPAAMPVSRFSQGDSAKCTPALKAEDSAKCTLSPGIDESAFCSVGECILSTLPVQNAPKDIRKRNENLEVKQKPCVEAEADSPELVGSEVEGEQLQELPLDRDEPLLTLVAAPSKSGPDPRHAKCREICRQYAEHAKVAVMWDGSEARALAMLLKAAPQLTVDGFAECVRNRARSDVSHGERPRLWLPTLTKFQAGPLDRYGVPKEAGDADGGRGSTGNAVHGNRDEQRSAGNVAAAQRAFAALTGCAP